MRIPAVRERVNMEGRKGVFLVIAVDRERQVAHLIPTTGPDVHLEEDVPFSRIILLRDPARLTGERAAD
jgi:hypothetical protein